MICSKCKEDKNIKKFPYKNKDKKIKSTVCGKCQRLYKRKHYYLNKDTHYRRNKEKKR